MLILGKSSIFKMIHVNEPWTNISYNISWPNVDTHPWTRKLVSTSLSRTNTLMALSENKGQPKSWWLIIIFPIKHHHDWGRHIPLSDTPKHHIVGSISHHLPSFSHEIFPCYHYYDLYSHLRNSDRLYRTYELFTGPFARDHPLVNAHRCGKPSICRSFSYGHYGFCTSFLCVYPRVSCW